MKLRHYSSEGIVLARRNHSEADRLLTVFSKDHGKLILLAKGVRYPKSRKRGHIEIFSHIRFSTSHGHAWDIVTEVESINTFAGSRKDLKKITLGYYLVDVINKLTHEDEESTDLYQLTLETLLELQDTMALKTLRKNFVYKALVLLGFWPPEKEMPDPDSVLDEVLEKKVNTVRVGKKLLE